MKQKKPIISIENLTRVFDVGKNKIHALKGIDLKIYPQEFVVIFGPSGCGKTTLLNIMSGIDIPTSGKVLIRDKNIFSLDEEKRSLFRAKKIGIIHQMPYWVKSLNVVENIALPLILRGEKQTIAIEKAKTILNNLDFDDWNNQLPTQLSGGEQQRIGVARALISNPWILFADEPTGNLDSKASDEIMSLMKNLNENYKRTIVLITHNNDYWELGTRRIEMKDGKIIKDVHHG